MRLAILPIILSILLELKLSIVFLTHRENSSILSLVIWLSKASLFNFIVTAWKKFSIGFRSGLRACILKTFAPTLSMARIAALEFWRGHPSIKKILPFGFAEFRKAFLKQRFTIEANFSPVIVPSHCSQRTTPFPYAMATIKFTVVEPSFLPFAVHLNFNPCLRFLHCRARGARA